VAGGWRRLNNEEHHNLCPSKNFIRVIKSRRMRWADNVAHIGEMRKVYNILVGKPKRNRPLGRPRHRWDDNARRDLREILWEVVDWLHLAKNRDQWWALVNVVMYLLVLTQAGNF
jgi:hypothetical protein